MRGKRAAFLTLVAAEALFLCMFFAADRFRAGNDAARLAALWRHGMTGGWPFYMPGFFAISLAIAWWWRTTPAQHRLVERAAALVIAAVVGLMLTPMVTPSVLRAVQKSGGVNALPVAESVSPPAIGLGLFTSICWTVFVGCAIVAVQRRRPLVLLGAVPGFAVLHFIRAGAAAELVHTWTIRAAAAEPVAWLTLALIPVAGWMVWRIALTPAPR